MANTRIGCIGIGIMGSALMEAIIRVQSPKNVSIFDPDTAKLADFCKKTGATPSPDNKTLVTGSNWVFLAVKPQYLGQILSGIAPSLSPETILVSMAAGIPIETLRNWAGGHQKIVRIMPNTPVAVGSGVIAVAPDPSVSSAVTEELCKMLSGAGLVELTAEPLMDAVTAVSGSGPAYGYVFIEALADAAVQMGMPRAQAIRYAAATLRGSAEMVLTTGIHPAVLKDAVCSPGGTTIAAVSELEESGFRAAIIRAARRAWKRSKELNS